MTSLHYTHEFRLYWGGSDFRTELLSSLAGRATLAGRPIVVPVQSHDGNADVNTQYQVVGVGLGFTVPCRITDATDVVVENRSGIFALVGPGTEYAWVFSADVLAVPVTSPAGGILGVNLVFTQNTVHEAVQAVPTTSGAYAVNDTVVAYKITAGAITVEDSGGNVGSNELVVVGPPTQ